MIRKIAWETFKNTGDINSFMEYKQIENIEKELKNGLEGGFCGSRIWDCPKSDLSQI